MKILILNAGSSSLKFCLYELPSYTVITKGVCERIGLKDSFISIKMGDKNIKKMAIFKNHSQALEEIISELTNKNNSLITSMTEICFIGHMFVHGGKYFYPTIANDESIAYLKTAIEYAPVHIPKNIEIVLQCQKTFPDIENIMYFDTYFHSTLPDYAYTYAINTDYTKKYNIRKYGFHGSSHEYMSKKVLEYNKNAKKIITCHLGNGCSISAIKNGVCIDTSMGFTPLEGLVMGTRSGNIDPSIIAFLCNKYNKTPDYIIHMLNHQSGLLGICGYSDLRDIEKHMMEGNADCKLALSVYVYSIIKYIGSYISVLQGVDAICFGGGVGENSSIVREMVLDNFAYLNLKYDKKLNKIINRCPDRKLSTRSSKIDVYVISTDEEIIVAKRLFDFWQKKA